MRSAIQISLLTFILLLAWLLPGLIGHDPWKPDEAYSMGLVYHIIKTGDWVVPTLAGEPFMEKPPLFFVTAAFMAKNLSNWLPLHDGGRLAGGFYIGIAMLFIALTGRTLYGKGNGIVSMLIAMGCLGMVFHTHQMITDTAMIAGFSMAICGLALSLTRPALGGLLLGVGAGIGFMSKGLLAPAILGCTVLILPMLAKEWRSRSFLLTLLLATLCALPWLAIWPYILYHHAPEPFNTWLWENNLGRFLGFSRLVTPQDDHYITRLPWFAWPALPLAMITLWQQRGTGWRLLATYATPPLLLPLVVGTTLLATLTASSAMRELYLLPLIPPLALLATPAVVTGRWPYQTTANLIVILFGASALLIWGMWLLARTSIPTEAWMHDVFPAELLLMREHGGIPFQTIPVSLAAIATAVWLFGTNQFAKSARRTLLGWTAGVTLLWLLAMTLWLPVINHGKSYRLMLESMQKMLPTHYNCMASRGLGEPQRAVLYYNLHIITKRVENGFREELCDLLLVASDTSKAQETPVNRSKLWEGNRPGDTKERYVLYSLLRQQAPPVTPE